MRSRAGTLNYRPVVRVLWALVALLTVPFYMFSQRELAPEEDQGVVFAVVQAAANSTVEQTTLFTQQIHDVYRSIPETESIFQITFPTGGFGGMVTKPWSERTKTTQQLPMESMGPLSQIPGVRAIPLTPPARIQGVIPPAVPLDRALTFLEEEARKILPQGFTIDYAGESRPLILASGPGAGARNSIGIMLVSGMVVGTLFTLFVVPTIYVVVAKTRTAAVREPARSEGVVGGLAEAAS